MALREAGWSVSGTDANADIEASALKTGVVDTVGTDTSADITFVATPASATPAAVAQALEATTGVVTDVAGVKESVVHQADHPNFVGGHPMAGSEQDGLAGARADLFTGATWVLTPSPNTNDDAYAQVRNIVAGFGADVVAIDADAHDLLVAVVSHVPHLTAATLMGLADARADDHRALLRLAAGGFRDMTRIASGGSAIWRDVCAENRTAILDVLDELIAGLGEMRQVVADRDGDELVRRLELARAARVNLPTSAAHPDLLSVVRVPIADRSGEVARVATLATELDVNLLDLEIAHSAEGQQGVLILVVDTDNVDLLTGGLIAKGYRPSSRSMQ